ncbi:MAG: hypothetical protein JWO98_1969 [Frankiales bacterium]|nr:hypothetical protein [Frankiales bacterium]
MVRSWRREVASEVFLKQLVVPYLPHGHGHGHGHGHEVGSSNTIRSVPTA